MRKRAWVLFTVVSCCVLASCGEADTPAVPHRLRLAVFNAEDFNSDALAGTGTWGSVADVVATNGIDIIMLCETEPYDRTKFVEALSNRGVTIDYRMTTSNTDVPTEDDNLKDEISLWSRYPISSFEQILRGNYTDPVSGLVVNAPRYILRASVDVAGRKLWFYGAHLKAADTESDRQRRRAQARALEVYILDRHAPEREYIVTCGDMNTITPAIEFVDNGTIGYLTLKSDNPGLPGNDFTAANLTALPLPGGYTWRSPYTGGFPDAILDHMILSPALQACSVPDSVRVLLHDTLPRLSDHYPVMLDVELR